MVVISRSGCIISMMLNCSGVALFVIMEEIIGVIVMALFAFAGLMALLYTVVKDPYYVEGEE